MREIIINFRLWQQLLRKQFHGRRNGDANLNIHLESSGNMGREIKLCNAEQDNRSLFEYLKK